MSCFEDFVEAASRSGARYALLGAWAVAAVVSFRTTHDVDVAVERADLWRLRAELEPLGYVLVENPRLGKLEFKHRERGDIDVYTESVSGVPVGLILERAVEAEVSGRRVSVASPEDLLLMKAAAGRERDMADAAAILAAAGERLDWEYMARASSELGIPLRDFLLRSLSRLPIQVSNPPKVRKALKGLVEEKLG
ncbi:MAG: hypothetical protein DRO06_04870 [Thermoproteota archaeon]|nr:MAG: hypothetical protein DRO06_04870 [Candidatus Korarchaeota archaeon]